MVVLLLCYFFGTVFKVHQGVLLLLLLVVVVVVVVMIVFFLYRREREREKKNSASCAYLQVVSASLLADVAVLE